MNTLKTFTIITSMLATFGFTAAARAQIVTDFYDFSGSQYADDFTDVRRGAQINGGAPDLGGTGHTALNFTGAAGPTGDTWLTKWTPSGATRMFNGRCGTSVAASVLIAVPTGVKLFNWSATMVGGRVRFSTPMLFCLAALLQFLLGGLTGISHALAPLDWQTKNSYYLVAHFHNVFVGLIVFAILGGIYYWFPKMSGRMMSERIGKWTFWLMTIGFNLTFMIQHVLGLAGMPRRTYTYLGLFGFWEKSMATMALIATSVVICVVTGHGLKDPDAAGRFSAPPISVAADPDAIAEATS